MSSHGFHLFAYGTLRRKAGSGDVLDGAVHLGEASVEGTLYDIEGRFPALLLYGRTPVKGEVWRCHAGLLPRLDAYEATVEGVFRRVGVEVNGVPCWTYVAGPGLARRLTPDRRIPGGDWVEHAGAR